MKAGVFFNNSCEIFMNKNVIFSTKQSLKSPKVVTVGYKFDQLLKVSVIRYQCSICQMKAGVFLNNFSVIFIGKKGIFNTKQSLNCQKDRNCDCLFTNLLDY